MTTHRMATALLLGILTGSSLAAQQQPGLPKSPGHGVFLSTVSTLAPVAAGAVVLAVRPRGPDADEAWDVIGGSLISLGVLGGPAVGHLYAGRVGLLVPRLVLNSAFGLWVLSSDDLDAGAGRALLVSGITIGLTVLDITRVPRSVRAWNAEHGMEITLIPLAGGAGPRLGIGLRARL